MSWICALDCGLDKAAMMASPRQRVTIAAPTRCWLVAVRPTRRTRSSASTTVLLCSAIRYSSAWSRCSIKPNRSDSLLDWLTKTCNHHSCILLNCYKNLSRKLQCFANCNTRLFLGHFPRLLELPLDAEDDLCKFFALSDANQEISHHTSSNFISVS